MAVYILVQLIKSRIPIFFVVKSVNPQEGCSDMEVWGNKSEKNINPECPFNPAHGREGLGNRHEAL